MKFLVRLHIVFPEFKTESKTKNRQKRGDKFCFCA